MTAQIVARPGALDIYLTRANNFSAPFQFRDVNGHPITTWGGYTMLSSLRRYVGSPESIDLAIDDTNKATGLWVLSLSLVLASTLTRLSPQAEYAWDLLRIDDTGNVKTLLAGTCYVLPNITEPPS